MTAAIVVALLSAVCFALAATLQQREARSMTSNQPVDYRLLQRLIRRPLWLAGVVADLLSALLQVLALSLGPVQIVQPLGVAGFLFSLPLSAILNTHRLKKKDVAAGALVAIALFLMIRLMPASGRNDHVERGNAALAVILAVGSILVVALLGQFLTQRTRGLTFAATAGAIFGISAVIIRAIFVLWSQPGARPVIVGAILATVLLIPTGYLLLQNAYRSEQFAATLAIATVLDPLVAIAISKWVLDEQLPTDRWELLIIAISGVAIVVGISNLAKSKSYSMRSNG